MKDRIVKFLTQEGLSATKFADEIGVQRSSVSHLLSGRNNPSYEFIQKFLNRYKSLNADWLLLGTGTMYKKAEQMNLFTSIPSPPTIQQPNLIKPSIEKVTPQEADKKSVNITEPEISPSRKIEKILVFYSDKTFDEFESAK